MTHPRAGRLFAAFVVAVGLFGSTGLRAQPAPVKIAVVDLATVSKQYKELTDKQAELQKWADSQRRYLEDLSQYIFLSEESFKEIADLLKQPTPLPEAKAARFKELAKLSDESDQDFRALRAKPARDAKEQDRFNKLQESATARQNQLQQIADQIDADAVNRRKTLQDDLMAKVNKVIADVAQAGAYTLVLDKQLVLFGGDDISAAVVAKLNPAAPAPTPAPAPAPTPAPAPAPAH